MPLKLWLIARSVLIEAIRRREVYAIVLVSTLLIISIMGIDFFGLKELTKFYRESALKVMSIATGLTVVVLAARQLPREFEMRTIYTLMARPISRTTFLAGKLFGVMLAAAFCFLLFTLVYLVGTLYLGGDIPWVLFAQHVYLQLLTMLILASLSFWLSMMLNLDAAITIGSLFFLLAAMFTNVSMYIYDYADAFGRFVIKIGTFIIPQLTLLDLSERTTHAQSWSALDFTTMAMLTGYALIFAAAYFALAMLWFRKREL